jgi:hypothetical protein
MHLRVIVVVALAAGLALVAPTKMTAAGPTLPTVTVSGVTATSPVLQSTSQIDVNANVTATFDTNSTTPSNVFTGCNNGNDFCSTLDGTVKSKKVVTTAVVTVSGQTTTASATSPAGSSGPSAPNVTAWTGSILGPPSGSDGDNTVTVNANVSETVTTCITTDTSYWTGSNGTGSQVGSTTTVEPACDAGVVKTGSGSANGSYVRDINPPTLTLQPNAAQPTVLQGEDKNIHNVLIDGSSEKAYTLTDTAFGPGGYTASAPGGGAFGKHSDGIAPKEHDLVGIHIACDAPTGPYSASAVANTVDLGGNAFPPISSVDYAGPPAGGAIDAFEVLPGQALESQTFVVSELPPNGDYAPMSCFTAQQSGRKISTFPGSLHIAAVVNTTGPCAGFGTISGTTITLTLPAGFSFDKTGNSPAAHVFVFPAAGGFDYHYPDPASEVTNLIPKPQVLGQTVTVDLSSLDLGGGAGVIPATDTIYIRAHAVFTGGSVPPDETQYSFNTSVTSTIGGVGVTTASSSQIVTKSSACVDGNPQ